MTHPFTPEMFERMDDSDDPLFYTFPRKVVHIDDPAIAAAGKFMAETFAPHGVLLDLMSSWRSHLPAGFVKQRMVGLGLNAEEMADNPDLDEHVVHDLNVNPRLPFADDYFDGAVVTVSIQYMIRPLEIFTDVRRVLKPGAPFIVLFSNRMFPTKAVRIWRQSSDQGHIELVAAYMDLAGNFEEVRGGFMNPETSPPGDPLFLVLGRKCALTPPAE